MNHLQTYIENNLDFEIKDFIQLTCIMPILLNIYILNALYIYLMQISFVKKKGILIGYIAVTWGALPRYNDQQSI